MENLAKLIDAGRDYKRRSRKSGKLKLVATNHEGAPAFYRTLREQVVQILTTGTFGDTFYASGKDLAAEALEVLIEAREKIPEFLARAIVYARSEGLMKLLPVVGLVVLSGGRGRCKTLFETIFPQVILLPDDLRAFVALSESGAIPGRKGFGGVAVDASRAWLTNSLSEYHAVKYGSSASREITLGQIIRKSHPRANNPALSELFGWLVNGASALGENQAQNPQIRAFESLKTLTAVEDQVAAIRRGRLPYKRVLASISDPKPEIWVELLYQAPYMNLLRNLVTFTRHGVFRDEANVQYAVEKLTNPKAVEHSKVFPFQFFSAWKRYIETEGHDSRLADALRQALDMSFVSMPSFGNRTVAIGSDVSGSMSMGLLSEKSSVRYIDICGIFTGALLRKAEGRVIPLPFDTDCYPDCGLSGRDDILTTTEKLAEYGGGGTAVGAPIEHLLRTKTRVDVFVGITDNVDWCYGQGYGGASDAFFALWKTYRREVAPDARAYLVTIDPGREVVAPTGAKGVRFIYGWSDAVLKYIMLDVEAGENQIRHIEHMSLQIAAGRNGTAPEHDMDAQTGD